MYSKNILSLLTLGLLTLAKVNGGYINKYNGKYNDVYKYVKSKGKIHIFNNFNEEGKVTDLNNIIENIEPSELVNQPDDVEPSEVVNQPSENLLKYHQQCLEELKPYEICYFETSSKLYREYADYICEFYEQANCREFYKSPFTFAPSCEKTVDTFEYDIIGSYNRLEHINFQLHYSLTNLYCSKKSSGKYCNPYNEVMLLYDDEKYNMDISLACGEDQCRESLIDYFVAYIEEGFYGDGELINFQKRVDYLRSDKCM